MSISRRTLLAATALSQSRILGANDRPRLGAIGLGGRMRYLLEVVNKLDQADIAAMCDVYEPRADQMRAERAPQAKLYTDFRALLDDKSLDAVVIASPDHWHVPMITAAIAAGKDVYCEKPVTHTIEEGDVLLRAVQASNRIVQVGTQQRSWSHFKEAGEQVRNGALGTVVMVQTYWYQNYQPRPVRPAIEDSKLNWKQWLGDAPDQNFSARRYTTWRWFWDFGGGHFTDLFSHWVDVVHWYMGVDTPVKAQAMGGVYILKDLQCPDTIDAAFEYPGGFVTTYNGTIIGSLDDGGMIWRGTKGVMKLDRSGYAIYPEVTSFANGYPPATVTVKSREDGTINHMRAFLECVRSRQQPNAPVTAGIAAARAAHIGNREYRKRQESTVL